jgi:hypothetical protein
MGFRSGTHTGLIYNLQCQIWQISAIHIASGARKIQVRGETRGGCLDIGSLVARTRSERIV